MTAAELEKIIKENYDNYEYIALRVCNDYGEIGEKLPKSYVWDDGVKTDEELDGVSGIELDFCAMDEEVNITDELDIMEEYLHLGDVIVIAGNYKSEYSNDYKEINIIDAVRIA